MAGIDAGSAALGRRAAFAFTKTEAAQAMREALRLAGLEGCVLFSTCNRTELWCCREDGAPLDPAALLCRLKGLPAEEYDGLLTVRREGEAVSHLFETACGLQSQIFGEDQILAQVKDAVAAARAAGTAGKTLGRLFQCAVSCAKKVKTRVMFPSGGASVAQAAAKTLRELCGGLRGRRCLVVGNGAMGRDMAETLIAAGAEVVMTLRQYKHGVCAVPQGCGTVLYDGRFEALQEAEIAVSATTSPHFTLRAEPVAKVCAKAPGSRVFLDLAVPRDIEPAVGELPGCRLLTIDDIPCGVRQEERALAVERCREIIAAEIEEFGRLREAQRLYPVIRELSGRLADAFAGQLEERLVKAGLPAEQREELLELAKNLANDNAEKTLYAFRDWLEEDRAAAEAAEKPAGAEEPAGSVPRAVL